MALAPKKNILRSLKRLVPLNTLSDKALKEFIDQVQFQKLKSGDYLFRQGDTAPNSIYLLSGEVALFSAGREVERVTADSDTARFPLAHQVPRKVSARALGRVECVEVDKRFLSELLGQSRNEDYKVDELTGIGSDDWMSQLLQSRIFQQIPAANIQSVMMRMEQVPVKTGDEVIRQGGEGDYFFLIHKGKASVTRRLQEGAEPVELARLGAGDAFGEEALLSDSPRNSTVTMLSDGVLLRLGKEDFVQLVKRPLARVLPYEEAATRAANGALWLDVRTPQEYEEEHIEGSINIPLSTIRYEASSLAQDRQYLVYCDLGQQSATAAFLLIEHGLEASVLSGGIGSAPPDARIKGTHPHEKTAFVTPIQPEEPQDTGEVPSGALIQAQAGLEKAKGQIRVLAAQLKKLEEQNRQAEAKWSAERKALKEAFDKSKSLLEASKKQHSSGQASLQELQQSLAKAQAQSEAYGRELEAMRTERDRATEKVGELTTVLEQRQSDQGAADAQQELLQKAQAEAREYKTQLESVKAEHEATEEELVKLTVELEKQREAVVTANRERDELSRRVDELFAEQDAGDEQEQALSAMHQELERVRGENKEEMERLREQLEQAEAASESVDDPQLEELRGALEKSEQRLKDLNIEKNWQQEELEFLRKAVQEAKEAEKKSLDPALEEELDSLRVELDVVKAHAAAEKDELQKELEQLKIKVPEEELDEIAQTQELERLRGLVEKREQQIEQADGERQQLEDALEDRDGDIDQLKRELEDARVAYAQLQQEIEQRDTIPQPASEQPTTSRKQTDGFESSSRNKPNLFSIALGALLLFILIEVMALVLGGGELFSLLLGGGREAQPDTSAITVLPEEPDADSEPALVATPPPAPKTQKTKKAAKDSSTETAKASTTGLLLRDVKVGPPMIRIDGGEFRMGNKRNQLLAEERPTHEVVVPAFAISRSEVTFREYDQFARATGRKLPNDNGWGRGKRPVINVSWEDAKAYVKWLSGRSGKRYRLPTEAEWEFAARSGSDSSFWWGYKTGKGNANCFDCGSQWDRKSTAPVGSFKANGFGLFDMAGNVREWVEDCYHKDYAGAPTDGSAWVESGCKERVARDGAYNKPAESMRSSARSHFKANTRLPNVGFRVVRELD